MTDPIIIAAGILGLALILAVTVYAVARVRIEQQRTLQKLIERGSDISTFANVAGIPDRRQRDLWRGGLLIMIGVSWSLVTFFVGGKAWMLGIVPVLLGAVVLLLRKLDERSA